MTAVLIMMSVLGIAWAADDEAPKVDDAQRRVEDVRSGVVGGKHDFSERTGRPEDACAACHTPHVQAVRRGDQDAGEGDAILEIYRIAGQRDVSTPDRFVPGPTSLICMSCHNGTVAASTIGASGRVLADERVGFELPETAALHDHPIGVPYPSNRKGYRPPGGVESRGVALPNGRVECISCHDPHDAKGVDKMLVMSNRRSDLCLACHIK